MRMNREPCEEAKDGALGDDHGEASAALQANPSGRYSQLATSGRIAALLVACVATPHGAPRALRCIPEQYRRTRGY
ncbi:MAG TPA: hypothetical protein VFW00_14155 [Rhodocyclaceae bacterium]|nr:hypothetical protein [Rhodocyclaceae bacterium]